MLDLASLKIPNDDIGLEAREAGLGTGHVAAVGGNLDACIE